MSINEWFYSDTMNKVRQDMLDGTRNPMCTHCYKKDDIGVVPPSVHHNDVWKNKNVDYDNPTPMYFDLKPSNHCNLACIFCTPSSSDKITKITESLPREDQPDRWRGNLEYYAKLGNPASFDDSVTEYILEHIDDLEILKFTGGEPFLIADVLDIVTRVSEIKPDIKLQFTSNGSAIPKEFYPILNKIKDVHIKISIDAVDSLYDYIRYPSRWEVFEPRLRNLFASLPNVKFDINTLITNMSLEQIPKIIAWYKEISSEYSNLKWITIDPNLTPENNESSLYMMDPDYILRVKEKLISENIDWDLNPTYKKIDDTINRNLFHKDYNISRFKNEFRRQDKIRRMNIIDLVEPITREFFETYLNEIK